MYRFRTACVLPVPLGSNGAYLRAVSAILPRTVTDPAASGAGTFARNYVYDSPLSNGEKWMDQIGATAGVRKAHDKPRIAYPAGSLVVAGGISGLSEGAGTYVRQSGFIQSPGQRVGISGRKIVPGPGFYNFSASIFKVISITESTTLEIRGESFSVLNGPHFCNPDTNVADQYCGYIRPAPARNATGSESHPLTMPLNQQETTH